MDRHAFFELVVDASWGPAEEFECWHKWDKPGFKDCQWYHIFTSYHCHLTTAWIHTHARIYQDASITPPSSKRRNSSGSQTRYFERSSALKNNTMLYWIVSEHKEYAFYTTRNTVVCCIGNVTSVLLEVAQHVPSRTRRHDVTRVKTHCVLI